MLKYCTKCKNSLFEQQKFCDNCGKSADDAGKPYCANGHKLDTAFANYCPECGIKVDFKKVEIRK